MAKMMIVRTTVIALSLLGLIGGRADAAGEDFHQLIGTWARTDGTYTLVIAHVDRGGQAVASFYNGRTFTDADATARHTAGLTELDVNLRHMGRSSHSYHLRYDAATDRLIGTYHHHVFRQDYEIFFVRQ